MGAVASSMYESGIVNESGEPTLSDGYEKAIRIRALEIAAARWAVRSTVVSLEEMCKRCESKPDRDDENSDYHPRFGHIQLGNN